MLNINFDGLGYKEGLSAVSFYEMPEDLLEKARAVFSRHPAISEGPPWPQGDHSIFVQFGCPAIAFTSEWFSENINDQDITHTPKDNLSIVAPERLPEVARAVAELALQLG